MRKKLLSYSLAALAIITVSLAHNVLGRPGSGSAIASASGYIGQAHLDYKSQRLLKSVSYRPDNLLQVSARDVRALLNEPELIREDLPTTIWQYRSEACVLDIYFQTPQKSEASPVAHYEIRARGKGVPDEDVRRNCIRSLVEARGGTRMVDVSAFYKSN